MTSAPATTAARGSTAPPGLVFRVPLRRLVLTMAAFVASCALAIGTRSGASLAAAILAAMLLLATSLVVRASAAVSGPRRVPRWYGVVAIAAAAAVLVLRGVLEDWRTGATAAAAMLIAAAPGALAAAVEAPLWRALRRGLPHGVVLRHTSALPAAHDVRTLALDGLGTLVDGKVVDSVDPVDESHLRNLRWFGGALEHASDTPIGHAIAKLSARGNLTDIVEHPGRGISGSVDRHPTRVGSLDWIGIPAVDSPWDTVAVEVDGRPLGTITVADALREDAIASIAALRADGLEVVLIADAEDRRAVTLVDRAAITEIVPTAPESAAVLSPHTPAATLLLGPESQQVVLAQADVGSAVRALQGCRAADHATRVSLIAALGWHTVTVTLAAVGLLAPWAAATTGLLGTGIVWAAAARPWG